MNWKNHYVKTICTSVIINVLATSAIANESFEQCIPAETVNAFLGSSYYESEGLRPDIPDSFPEFELPQSFRVLGSIVRGHTTQVALASTLDRADSEDVMLTNLRHKGWHVLEPDYPAHKVGFVGSLSKTTNYMTLCHEDSGQLQFTSVQKPLSSIITLMTYRLNRFGRSECQYRNVKAQQSWRQLMVRYLPRMELPSAARSYTHPGAGSTGSTGGASTFVILETELTSNELFEYFSRQISAQGWTMDARWEGGITAGATWTQNPESELELVGTLSILALNEADFKIEYSLVSRENMYK